MELTVQKREVFGKQTRALRKKGFIPAELYGHKTENFHLMVPVADFHRVFREAGENTLVQVVFNNKKHPVLIHDVTRDPVTDEVNAVDFYQIRLDERIKIKIPLHFIGEAPAVKEKGGLLVKAMHELEIEAMPVAIPHTIEVDLAKLSEIGVSIHVKDLVLPADVKTHVNPETVVATITAKLVEEEITTAPETVIDSVKVETEEKKAERQAKKEEGLREEAPSISPAAKAK